MPSPPYFEILLSRLSAGHGPTVAAFGRHVHWGYWDCDDPSQVPCTPQEYGRAAERLCRAVCDRAGIRDGQRILDAGCGFGGALASLNERFSNLTMLGVNIDGRQLQRAKEQIQPLSGNTIDYLEADAAHIPVAGESYDVVLAIECIFHFDRRAFLAEARRLLRPGGVLAISDFVPHERAAEYIAGANLSADEAVRWSYGQIDLSCSLSGYRTLAKEAGLALVEETDITAGTLPTYDFLGQSMADWPEPSDVERFRRATGLLEKASRRGWLQYMILRFARV